MVAVNIHGPCARANHRKTIEPRSRPYASGRILGIPIYLHSTWVFIFLPPITYIIASQFNKEHPPVDGHTALDRGPPDEAFSSSPRFSSHELSPQRGWPSITRFRVVSITLFSFRRPGAPSRREPSKAIQEFNIAIAGPLASGLLAGGFFWLNASLPF